MESTMTDNLTNVPDTPLLTNNKKILFKYGNIKTIEEAYNELIKFMTQHKSNDSNCKFRSYSNPFIGLNITEEEYDTLAELLARYSILDIEEKPIYGICIGRKQEEKHVLMIDLDVKTSKQHKLKEYLPHFYKLAEAIAECIGSKKFRFFTRREYFCKKDSVWKNGAHVLFTDIVITSGCNINIESDKIKGCLEKIYEVDTSINKNDVIDKVSFGKGLIGLIGSRKPESHQYWECVLEEEEEEDNFHLKIDVRYTDESIIKRMEDVKQSMLFPTGDETEYLLSQTVSTKDVLTNKQVQFGLSLRQSSQSKIDQIAELINIKFLTDYESWLKIGMAIKQSGGNVELFDKISQKAKNYGGFDSIKAKWDSFKDNYEGNKITIGTLKYYARLSNPSGYENLCEKDKGLEYIANNYTDVRMIEYLYKSEEYSFIKTLKCRCNKEKNRTSLCASNWYSFNGIYYKEIDETDIKKKLFDPVHDKIETLNKEYKAVLDVINAYQNCEGKKNEIKSLKKNNPVIRDILISFDNDVNKKKIESLKKIYQKLVNKTKTVQDKLKDDSERNKLLTVLQGESILLNKDYIADYNNKMGTIVFENGVYDACQQKMITCKENTLSCGKIFTEPSEKTITLFDKYMTSLFSDIRIREFMYEIMAKLLTPDPIQYIMFFTGVGSNGKSVFITFLGKLLGDYFKGVEGGFFSGEVSKGAADPELVETIHKRCISVNEPAKNIKLSGSFIKSVTGDDYISARGLYKDTVTWKPTAKHIITCNDIPNTDDLTEGFKRRLIIIPFKSKFLTENAYNAAKEKGEPDVSIIDEDMIAELMEPETLNEIATLLVTKYYKKRCKYDLPDPCKKFNMEYIKNNDPMDSWLDERCILEEEAVCDLQVLYDNYKLYIEENTNEKKLPKGKFETLLKQKTKCRCSHMGSYPVTGIKLVGSMTN